MNATPTTENQGASHATYDVPGGRVYYSRIVNPPYIAVRTDGVKLPGRFRTKPEAEAELVRVMGGVGT